MCVGTTLDSEERDGVSNSLIWVEVEAAIVYQGDETSSELIMVTAAMMVELEANMGER